MDVVLGNLIELKISLLFAGGLAEMTFEGVF